MKNNELPKWLYLILPIVILVTPYILNAYFPNVEDFYSRKESGFVENLTVFLLLVALIYSVTCAVKFNRSQVYGSLHLLKVWFVLYSLGCLYYLGEEISWGQHLFDWATPESWMQINDQQETNLHNTLGVFDQLPRVLVTIGIVFGGLIVPLYLKNRKMQFGVNDLKYWVLPTLTSLPAAFAVLVISLHDKPFKLLDMEVPTFLNFNDGESKEALIAVFILIYILSVYYRGRETLFSKD